MGNCCRLSSISLLRKTSFMIVVSIQLEVIAYLIASNPWSFSLMGISGSGLSGRLSGYW